MNTTSTIYTTTVVTETVEISDYCSQRREKILSFDYLDKASQGDEEFRQEVLLQFIVQVPANLSKIENAIINQEEKTIRSVVHEMKTTVFVMGFGDLVMPYLKNIEAMVIKAADINLIRSVFNYVKKICTCAVEEARLYIR